MKTYIIALAFLAISGCATVSDKTPAEKASGYTYIPVDPFSVQIVPGKSCYRKYDGEKPELISEVPHYSSLLKQLPDNAVRMLIERFNASGTVTYGPGKLGAKGETYRVTVDYINADTKNFPILIRRSMRKLSDDTVVTLKLSEEANPKELNINTEIYELREKHSSFFGSKDSKDENFVEYNIPIYIGIGLRVTANVEVINSNANISGIGVIGAEAEAERLKGSLIVQTLGVNGKPIAAALPVQSELNRTTAQNAIVAVGSIKSLLYADETAVAPRVVGIYLPFPGGKPLVNALISEISKNPIQWELACDQKSAPAAAAESGEVRTTRMTNDAKLTKAALATEAPMPDVLAAKPTPVPVPVSARTKKMSAKATPPQSQLAETGR